MTSWVQVGTARLQEAQDVTGLSNERLAREIPVSAKTWERWKKRGEIPAYAVPAVARALHIELRRSTGPVFDLDLGNGDHAGGEAWQREIRDEIRRGFEQVNSKLDLLNEQQRQAAAARP